MSTLLNKVMNNPLLRQSIYSLFARFTGVALNFTVILLITNQLQKSVAGDIMLLMTFITGIALISRLGIDQLLMKEVAGSHEENTRFRINFLKESYKAICILSFVFIGFWVIASPYLQHTFFYDGTSATVNLNELRIAGIGILFFNLVIINSTYLKAIKKTVLGVLGQNALTAISFLLLIFVLWPYFNENQYILYIYTASIILAGIIAAFFIYFSTFKRNISSDNESSLFQETSQNLVEIIKKSIPLAPISIISYLMIFTDTIMVGWFLLNEQVAEYSVASRISYIILFFLQAMEATIYPRLLNIYEHTKSKLYAFFWQSTALVVTVVLGVTGIMYLLSNWVLIEFGEEYLIAKDTLGILLIAQLFRAASITFAFMFIIREKVSHLNKILFSAFFLNIICNLLFINQYGIEGAAFATLAANAFYLLLILVLFYHHKLLTNRDIKT